MSKCVKCNKHAELACSRCGVPYCSAECQLRDWMDHKLICNSLPSLVASTSSSRAPVEAIRSKINPETNYERVVLFISNPNTGDVLISSERSTAPLPKMTSHPQQVLNQSQDISSAMTSIAEKLSEMTTASDSRQDSPAVANVAQKITEDNEVNESQNESSESNGASTHTLKNEDLPKFFFKNLKVIPLPEGKNISLLVTDTSLLDQFVIAAMDYENKASREIDQNVQQLFRYCKNAADNRTGYHPQVNELCLAIFDGEWYRALVIEELDDGTYSVLFFDYGNLAKVSSANIMPITEELMFPTCSNLCQIKEFNKTELPKLKKYFNSNALITCDVRFDKSLNIYKIQLVNVDAMLK